MTLKQSYFDGSTGLQTKLNDAFDAGSALIASNLTDIANALIDNAAQGKTKFTYSLATTYQPSYLRANKADNLLAKAYLAGVQDGLAQEDIYSYEVVASINACDTVNTNVDLKFNFATT